MSGERLCFGCACTAPKEPESQRGCESVTRDPNGCLPFTENLISSEGWRRACQQTTRQQTTNGSISSHDFIATETLGARLHGYRNLTESGKLLAIGLEFKSRFPSCEELTRAATNCDDISFSLVYIYNNSLYRLVVAQSLLHANNPTVHKI
jgi:hypothetical protein